MRLRTFVVAVIAAASFVSTESIAGQEPIASAGRSRTFEVSNDVRLSSRVYGAGPPVILLPGLGGSAIEQFAALGPIIAKAGYTAVLIDPRGVGESVGPLESLTLHDLAADVATVIDELDLGPAVALGRAFGNRIARCLAADRPELVRAVVLLAAGGLVPMPEEVRPDFQRLFSGAELGEEERLELLRKTMFSPSSDPRVGLGLSFAADAGNAQRAATRATPVDDWWEAGRAPVLIVQGLDDRLAVPENGRRLKQQLGDRAKLVEISNAGHALLIERPGEVANAIVDYLNTLN